MTKFDQTLSAGVLKTQRKQLEMRLIPRLPRPGAVHGPPHGAKKVDESQQKTPSRRTGRTGGT